MKHFPVMAAEAVQGLMTDSHGLYLDATFGGGGHSGALLRQLSDRGRLVGMDRDPAAVRAGREKFAGESRLELVHSRFSQMERHLQPDTLAGVLMDLGISSLQLDDEARGFSFHAEHALDMRMNPDEGKTGAAWLSQMGADEMARVFAEYGAERHARAIAEEVVKVRELMGGEITAAGLSALICRIKPARDGRKHPATRVFQALRILVNDEMGELRSGLKAAVSLLRQGGRLVVISFHSLEDETVMQFLSQTPALNLIGRLRKPSAQEVRANPRARSALMRTAEKVVC